MLRGVLGSLAAAFIMIGQAWAMPVDVSIVRMTDCPGGCQVGPARVAERAVADAPLKSDGAHFQDRYSFGLTGAVDLIGDEFAIDLAPGGNIQNLAFKIFGPGMASLGVFSVANVADSTFLAPISFFNIAPGTYPILVSGLSPVTVEGGLHLLEVGLAQSTASQVSLLTAMWLFLAALAGLVSLSRMRKRTPGAFASAA